ncbi:ABC transporter permease [Psychrobacillus soli]|uniref:ABC transporter permease n=1 Tax=Psychrobacillus soli TaxID=1543965 RepID=A0A544SWY5_9BACI|nr:ABC transporter permease [Psychrobacillus soli]TQR09651.1 ABC transporter permease [Psychrobacillus soli]
MVDFIIKRIAQSVIVVFLALSVIFFLVRLSGDPTVLMIPADAPPEQYEEFRKQHGFDQPIYMQYVNFISSSIQGDFGDSIRMNTSAVSLVIERLPATFQLAFSALALSVLIAIPIGVISAYRRNSLVDRLGVGFTILGQAIPNFWLGLILIYLFSVTYQLLPSSGGGSMMHMLLPMATLAMHSIAKFARFTRSTMLDVLRKDYIRTAKASGTPTSSILMKYALKNAFIPLLTLISLELGTLLGGAVIVEVVFAWPGLGRLLMDALLNRDFPVVLAGVFFIALIYTIINFITDILYAFINPQIRLQ